MRLLFAILYTLLSIYGFSQKDQLRNFDEIVVETNNLPISFDLRETNVLSPVKTQPNGGCWTSASNATLESWLRTSGYGNYNFSDINLQLFNGFTDERRTYGNHLMSTAYYTRQSGPIIKNKDTDSIKFVKASVPHLVTDARFLPNNPNLIKQTIKKFGPVYSMMYFKREETDSITSIYYTEKKNINHVVSLVGWNDTLSTKKGRGVWITQNSLGPKYGDDGFFYIPFQDKNILNNNSVWTKWLPGKHNFDLYYLDTLGSYNGYGFDTTLCYGLIEYTAQNDGVLNKVATWIGEDSTSIKIEVYQSFNKDSKALSDLLISEKNELCRFAGYYTFELSNPTHLLKGEDFYILIKYSHPTNKKPLPVEQFVKDYANPHINSGRCWINPDFQKWPNTWYEVGLDSDYDFLSFDLNIRAYFLND